ncbi:MAG TPA: peptide deformylase [Deltaproteobacteria bacterium]|nr:MAG: peptide deformylase [Deltaproteobacteria bacterium GWC2_65_14]HBO70342.1 peptide deformylase [Deltaproteobacteria bacterium]
MAVLPILQFPDPLLKEKCAPVDRVTPELSSRVDDLLDTMRASPGCVGIAASQVGILQRILVVDVSGHKRGSREENHGLLVLVNPEILARGGRQMVREGCMSIPDYTANVQRAQWVLVDALDRTGKQVILEAVGFEAVAIQHEADHLDGLLFLDRVSSVKTDLFRRKRSR